MTFRQWNERACRLANALLGLGLAKGDRVAILAYNCVEWMEIYVALAKAGLVAVPINFRLVGREIAYIVEHCEARAFIVQDDLVDRVEPSASDLAIAAGQLRPLRRRARARGLAVATRRSSQRASASGAGASSVRPEDTWALMYTSGTTGRPKGAIRSHAGSALLALVTALDMGFTRDDTALLVMPMCHANSLYFVVHLHLPAARPASSTTARASIPSSCCARWPSEQVTFTSLVPTHYIMMLGLPDAVKAQYDVGSVSASC